MIRIAFPVIIVLAIILPPFWPLPSLSHSALFGSQQHPLSRHPHTLLLPHSCHLLIHFDQHTIHRHYRLAFPPLLLFPLFLATVIRSVLRACCPSCLQLGEIESAKAKIVASSLGSKMRVEVPKLCSMAAVVELAVFRSVMTIEC